MQTMSYPPPTRAIRAPESPRPPATVRLALWSTRHRKSVIAGWFALVIVLTLISGFVGKHPVSESSQPGDSGNAAALIDKAFPVKPPAGETVIFDTPNLTVNDPAYRAVVDDVVARLQALQRTDKATGTTVKTIGSMESYYTTGDLSRVTPDKHTLLLATELTGDPMDAPAYVKPMMDAVVQAQKDH